MNYYKILIADDALIKKAIGFYLDGSRCYDVNLADDLAIPVGGKRRSGMLDLSGEPEFPVASAKKIVKMLQRWPDLFPNVRLDRFDCYVEWGEPIPGLIQDDDEDLVVTRGRQFGYTEGSITDFIEMVRTHRGQPFDPTQHLQEVVHSASPLRWVLRNGIWMQK
jgi:hypothetical protein